MKFSRGLARWAGAHSQALGLSLLFVVMASAIFWFFAFFVPGQREAAIGTWRRDLSVIADARRDLLDRRISDALANASFVARFPSVRALVSSAPNESTGEVSVPRINAILSDFRNVYGERSISIRNAQGAAVASSDDPAPGAEPIALAREAMRSGKPRVDLVREPDGFTGFVVAVPVRESRRNVETGGTVLVVGDAKERIFDLLRQPFTAATGEAVLVRRDGDSVLYLSPLRLRPDPPLTFRRALNVPGFAARGALEGDVFGSFVDYRGAKVLAAGRMLKRAPWSLVIKIDEDEALAPLRNDVVRRGLTWGGLLLALIAATVAFWRSVMVSHEGKIAGAEARFGALVEQANDAIFLIGSDGRLLQANRAAEKIYGRTRGELLSMHAIDVRANGTRDALRRDMETAAARGNVLLETRHRRADGGEFPVEVNMGLVKVGDETLFLSIVRDITERKAAEDRIRALNRLLRTITEVNELLVRATNEESLLKDVCRILVSHGGYALAWVGRADRDTMRVVPVASAGDETGYVQRIEVRWDDTPEGRGPLGIAIREGHSVIVSDVQADPMVVPWRRLHPSPGFGSIAAIPVRRGGAVTKGLIVYSAEKAFIDDEELALLEELAGDLSFALDALDAREALRESEERYRALFGGMLNGFAYCEMLWENGRPYDFIFLAVNRAFGELTGLKDVVGRRVSDVIPGLRDSDSQLFETLGRVAFTGIPVALETYVQALGIWFSISAYSPKKGHFVAVFDNVTERKKAEVALLATQQQLAQSQKMEAVGRLAGGVAHDFNNLLTVIQGYGEMVRDSLSGDLRHESMEELLKAAGRAASLTRQLLAFSRKQVLEPKIVRLDAIVRETGRMLERLIGEHIALSLALPETLATVKADPGQIEQVVLNLAVNARDAMPGGGRLTISVDSVTEPVPIDGFPEILPAGRWVRLTVEDTGCGMEKETLAHAFEPFFTTKERGRGTGLGLSTVYGIVQQSDGHVQVTSAPGMGTAFRIYLPRSDEKKTSGPRPSVLSRQGTETVLVVEDEPAVRNLVRAVLERKGYVVLVAQDGAAALDLVDKHAGVIHVLLTDVVMPGMNGRDLAALVRARRPSIRVILMSGYTADVPTGLGTEGGPAFLSKPFTEQALTAKLREALDTPQA